MKVVNGMDLMTLTFKNEFLPNLLPNVHGPYKTQIKKTYSWPTCLSSVFQLVHAFRYDQISACGIARLNCPAWLISLNLLIKPRINLLQFCLVSVLCSIDLQLAACFLVTAFTKGSLSCLWTKCMATQNIFPVEGFRNVQASAFHLSQNTRTRLEEN